MPPWDLPDAAPKTSPGAGHPGSALASSIDTIWFGLADMTDPPAMPEPKKIALQIVHKRLRDTDDRHIPDGASASEKRGRYLWKMAAFSPCGRFSGRCRRSNAYGLTITHVRRNCVLGRCRRSNAYGLTGERLTARGQHGKDVAAVAAALDVLAVPEGVEQQRPGSEACAFPAGITEQRLDRAGHAKFGDSRLRRDQRPELRTPPRDPFADRHGEAALLRHRLRLRHMLLDPAAQHPLAESLADLEIVGQAERRLGHGAIEERRAALDAMRHQAAVELGEKVVGQPVGAIGRLRHLEPRAAGRRGGELGRLDAVAPAGELGAQHAEPFEIAAAADQLAAEPPRPHHRAIAAVAGEQLVAALARQDDLQSGGARGL